MKGFRAGRGWNLGGQLDKVVLNPSYQDHWGSFLKIQTLASDLGSRICVLKTFPRCSTKLEGYCDKPIKGTRPQKRDCDSGR